jgi:lipopolysaccharide/colanic/teichoic acid biosynthesis glycosyltransferase
MWTKRLFDILCVLSGLIVLSPLFFLIAIWVKLDSKGPIFFRQTRIGLAQKPFSILKFRSMQHQIEDKSMQITVGADPRITRSGQVLRKLKLDELPQLFNVLVGDMSLVGPRPEVPRYVALYPEAAKQLIFSVRPGITDQASILFRDESTLLAAADDPEQVYINEILPIKLEHHQNYARQHSLRLDFQLILRTLWLLIIKRSRHKIVQ